MLVYNFFQSDLKFRCGSLYVGRPPRMKNNKFEGGPITVFSFTC